uniref:THAP-type domain-containing protein n=1 Tax=Oryzias sinensis TaxID=183150 RepID=A0A8C7YYR0_9TELE
MPSRCVAAGCSNTSSESVSVYKFPKQETANWVPTASSTLCSEHFEYNFCTIFKTVGEVWVWHMGNQGLIYRGV